MLYDEKQVSELHFMKHRHDDFEDYVDYEKDILTGKLSPYVFKNDMMNQFLLRMQPLVSKLFDQMNVIKNFQNYVVDKYHYKHQK